MENNDLESKKNTPELKDKGLTLSRVLFETEEVQNSSPQKTSPKRSLKNYLFRCFLWIFLICFIFTCGCSFYLYVNRDEIKGLFIQEINRHLLSPVSVQDIQLSMMRDFPKVSVTFMGTSCYGTRKQDPEILFTAENITLSFDLKDLLRKQYIVREILVRGGEFNLKHYGKGNYNYIIWKRQEDTSRKVTFHLQKVVLKNTLIRFRDLPARHDFQVRATHLHARGDLYENGQEFRLRGDIDVHRMTASDFSFLNQKKAALNLHFINSQEEKCFTVKEGNIKLANLQFEAQGFVRYLKSSPYLDFRFVGKKMRLESLILMLPESEKKLFSDYIFNGNLNFSMDIKGDYTQTPLTVLAGFELSQARIRHRPSRIEAKEVFFKGQFANGKELRSESCRLKIDRFFAKFPSGTAEGFLSIHNFKHPEIEYRGKLSAELSEIQQFTNTLTEYPAKGSVMADLHLKHIFPSLKPKEWKTTDLLHARLDGKLTVKDFHCQGNRIPEIRTDSLTLHFSPKVIKTDEFTLHSGQSGMKARLFVENLIPFIFFKGQNLFINAQVEAAYLDLDPIIALTTRNHEKPQKIRMAQKKDSQSDKREWIENIYADIELKARTAVFCENKVENFSCFLHYTPGDVIFDHLSLSVFQGHVDADIAMSQTPSHWIINGKGKVENLDIGSCFHAFRNFGQESLTYRNISGLLSCQFEFSIPYSLSGKKWETDQLVLWTDANIKEGILQNMESLKSISRFTGENDLQNIQFEDLRSTVSIENRTIRFSKTHVVSDAANLFFEGTHNFDNQVNYMVNIELSDLLSKRRKNRIHKDEEFGVVQKESSKIMLPLSIVGTWPDVEIRYAMKEARKGAGERLKESRVELKESLQDEFSVFRKRREKKKEENQALRKRENGEFLIDTDDVGIKDKTKANDSMVLEKNKSGMDTVKKKRYKTEDDFRIEFEDE